MSRRAFGSSPSETGLQPLSEGEAAFFIFDDEVAGKPPEVSMKMVSTRGAGAVTPSMAILRGLAPDGGLYVPESFPAFSIEEIASLGAMP